jgi:hypothetical protein
MAENRLKRDAETREKTVHKKAWARPTVLPDPIPQDGYKFQPDSTNISSKLREGWEPVRAEDHPEIFSDAVADARFKDNVIVGGLMLCKAPIELVAERTEYYENLTESQMRSVDQGLMRENDPRMPLFNDRKTKVTFGKGN